MDQLALQIEALIFVSEEPLQLEDMQATLQNLLEIELSLDEISEALASLQARYSSPDFAFEIIEVAGGFEFYSKPSYNSVVNALLKHKSKKKLSRAALETLSIIAYKQPVTRRELEKIRGVSCDYAVNKLLEKDLIEIKGRSEELGRPLIYGTSEQFMRHFGLKSMKELPKLKELQEKENSIGEEAEEA